MTRRAPMCAKPLAPPPLNTTPTFGRLGAMVSCAAAGNVSNIIASIAKDHQVAFLQCVARQSIDQYAVTTIQERLKTIVGNGEDGGYKSPYQKHQRQQTKTIDNEQEPLAQHRCAACRFFFHGLVVHCQLLIVQGLRSSSVEAI